MAEKTPFIGEMDRIIKVYRVDNGVDELSAPVPVDVLVASPYAKRNDVSGSTVVDGAVKSLLNRSYTIWRNPAIVNGLAMFVEDNGQRFEVETIKEIGRSHLELIVMHHE